LGMVWVSWSRWLPPPPTFPFSHSQSLLCIESSAIDPAAAAILFSRAFPHPQVSPRPPSRRSCGPNTTPLPPESPARCGLVDDYDQATLLGRTQVGWLLATGAYFDWFGPSLFYYTAGFCTLEACGAAVWPTLGRGGCGGEGKTLGRLGHGRRDGIGRGLVLGSVSLLFSFVR